MTPGWERGTISGDSPIRGTQVFAAPSRGDTDDWVLVLEDAGRDYPLDLPEG